MMKSGKKSETATKELQKRDRGRPPKVPASEVVNRADDYRGILQAMWDQLWPPLSVAETKEDVIAAIQNAGPYQRGQFVPSASLMLKIVQNRSFPKRRQTRINYLADSIAARGVVTPRRSRDICAQERAKAKQANHIIRYEFYVECSCGYKGQSRDHGCPKCGASISDSFPLDNLML
jgi:hypothetical protein